MENKKEQIEILFRKIEILESNVTYFFTGKLKDIWKIKERITRMNDPILSLNDEETFHKFVEGCEEKINKISSMVGL